MKVELDDQHFLQESAIEYPYVCYAPTLKKSRLHFVRDAAAEKEFDIAI